MNTNETIIQIKESCRSIINWEKVRQISQIVQDNLEDNGIYDYGDYHCVLEVWENELRRKSAPRRHHSLSNKHTNHTEKPHDDNTSEEKIKNNTNVTDIHDNNNIINDTNDNDSSTDDENIDDENIDDEENQDADVLEWYSKAAEYWENEENCPADVGGVLGGYGYVSPVDIDGSNAFLDKLYTMLPNFRKDIAIDCGAGIGRVAKHLLADRFEKFDILEQSLRLIEAAPEYMGEEIIKKKKIRNLICLGLQDFIPEKNSYDLIWIQWVTPHLTDIDFIAFLRRCKQGLRDGGVICVKENIIENGMGFDVDKTDSSLTRCDPYFKTLFNLSDLEIILEEVQEGFPDELYTVKTYALV